MVSPITAAAKAQIPLSPALSPSAAPGVVGVDVDEVVVPLAEVDVPETILAKTSVQAGVILFAALLFTSTKGIQKSSTAQEARAFMSATNQLRSEMQFCKAFEEALSIKDKCPVLSQLYVSSLVLWIETSTPV
ncbi:hypothetical protein BDR07DRAFT_1615922 [Suillus spraguei]|nr:hypothetical protein BDR07DRAFT_1615922 [Suillus spraguei]